MKKKLLKSLRVLLVAAGLCVGASAWADEINASLNHTAGSSGGKDGKTDVAVTLNADQHHFGQDNNNYYPGYAFAKFSFTIPSGHNVTQAKLSYTYKNPSGKKPAYKVYYLNVSTDIDFDSYLTTYASDITGLRLNNSRSWAYDGPAGTAGADNTVNDVDVTSAVRTIVSAGQSYIIFQWTGHANGADLYGKTSGKAPTLVITTSSATLYTASFTANEGAIKPSVTIYSDAERTSAVMNGTLADKTTYYYRATLNGYNDYEGEFTVDGSNPSVAFTMTPKATITSLTYKYMCGETLLDTKTLDNVAGLYAGEQYTATYQKYWANGSDLYVTAETNTRKSITLETETVVTVNYSLSASGEYYFYEYDGSYTTRADAESNGSAKTGKTTTVTIPSDGSYIITANCYGNAGGRTATMTCGETELVKATTISIYAGGTDIKSELTAFAADDIVTVTLSDAGSAVDYIILQKFPTSVTASITSSTGYATFSSTYALDFTSVTDATAYIATSKSGDNIQMQAVTGAVAAGTGLVLKSASGSSATVTIPVAASGTTYNTESDPKNYLFAISSDYNLNKSNNGTNYVLSVQSGKVVFAPIEDVAAPVTAGHAALWLPADVANQARSLRLSFDEETTGISMLQGENAIDNGCFNLSGQRVAQPSRGLYIVGGKKIIVK